MFREQIIYQHDGAPPHARGCRRESLSKEWSQEWKSPTG
jgi:hypothetical protein